MKNIIEIQQIVCKTFVDVLYMCERGVFAHVNIIGYTTAMNTNIAIVNNGSHGVSTVSKPAYGSIIRGLGFGSAAENGHQRTGPSSWIIVIAAITAESIISCSEYIKFQIYLSITKYSSRNSMSVIDISVESVMKSYNDFSLCEISDDSVSTTELLFRK